MNQVSVNTLIVCSIERAFTDFFNKIYTNTEGNSWMIDISLAAILTKPFEEFEVKCLIVLKPWVVIKHWGRIALLSNSLKSFGTILSLIL